jgi:hypothetical protein
MKSADGEIAGSAPDGLAVANEEFVVHQMPTLVADDFFAARIKSTRCLDESPFTPARFDWKKNVVAPCVIDPMS